MPIAAVLHFLLVMGCAVHVVRTGRPYYWLLIIFMFPLLGALVYGVAEVLPELSRSRAARRAVADARRLVDPDRDYREAQRALEIAPTVLNRQRLAEACVARGTYDEAVALYRACLTGVTAESPDLMAALADALFRQGEPAEALATLDRLRAADPDYRSAEAHLVYARALQALGRNEEALEEYEALVGYASGEEARLRRALLLKALGREAEARRIFEEIADLPRLAPKAYVAAQRPWIDLARAELGG